MIFLCSTGHFARLFWGVRRRPMRQQRASVKRRKTYAKIPPYTETQLRLLQPNCGLAVAHMTETADKSFHTSPPAPTYSTPLLYDQIVPP